MFVIENKKYFLNIIKKCIVVTKLGKVTFKHTKIDHIN